MLSRRILGTKGLFIHSNPPSLPVGRPPLAWKNEQARRKRTVQIKVRLPLQTVLKFKKRRIFPINQALYEFDPTNSSQEKSRVLPIKGIEIKIKSSVIFWGLLQPNQFFLVEGIV